MSENENEIVELPNESEEDKFPFKVGDVVVAGNSYKTPGKIIGIKQTSKNTVTLYVITAKKRFCEWSGSKWYFHDPLGRASYFENIGNYYHERAQAIRERAEAASKVTP